MTKSNESATNQKLLSLLALSAGALALPKTSDANIVYTPNVNAQVGYSGGFGSSFTLNLPGTHAIKLWRSSYSGVKPIPKFFNSSTTFLGRNRRNVRFGNQGGPTSGKVRSYLPATGGFFVKRTSAGQTWGQVGSASSNNARVGLLQSIIRRRYRSSYTTTTGYGPRKHHKPKGFFSSSTFTTHQVIGPGAFTEKYVAFAFQDSTNGNQLDYGWALLSMNIQGDVTGPYGPGGAFGPDVTLLSYAYDDGGLKIQTGQTEGQPPPAGGVPEPSSIALGALGALVLGAPALRRWRAQKKALTPAA